MDKQTLVSIIVEELERQEREEDLTWFKTSDLDEAAVEGSINITQLAEAILTMALYKEE